MSSQALQILDQSLTYALWAFLFILLVCLIFVSLRLKARRQGLADYFHEEFDKRFEREIVGEENPQAAQISIPLSDRLRMAVHALLISVLLSIVCLIVFGFVPMPFLDNFATSRLHGDAPLRVTALNYERFYEGFSLQGEVWNQTEEPIAGLNATILIWKSERELLTRVSVPIEPDPFPAASAATFSIRYTEHSPFLYGYQVLFESKEGLEVPHIKGFDVQ